MNKYEITVKETCETTYIVEANTKAEADRLFPCWVDNNIDMICNDLMRGTQGWTYSKSVFIERPTFVDVTYEELKSDA